MIRPITTREIVVDDLTKWLHGIKRVIWAMLEKEDLIDGLTLNEYLENLCEETGIHIIDDTVFDPKYLNMLKIEWPRQQTKKVDKVKVFVNQVKREVEIKMKQRSSCAFDWSKALNAKLKVACLPDKYLKTAADLIDWDKEPEENRPDFDNDSIDVIKAKLKTVEDKINKILET